ncbi:MAG: AbrB family transcriptional regulator [Pseudomonadota bacterium]
MPKFPHSISALNLPGIALILLVGLGGGWVAAFLGFPIPYLIGSLVAVACWTIARAAAGRPVVTIPKDARTAFVAIVGVMIGATFTPDLVAILPSLWLSLAAMIPYIGLALGASYAIFRGIGRYDRITALYCAMPGGLIESVSIGEQAGGDVRTLSLQHFIRIVLTVLTIPLLFLVWRGEAVGSAAGQGYSATPAEFVDVAHVLVLAAIGYVLGPLLRLPAGRLTGPLLLSAITHGTGIWVTASPTWLLTVAQLVIGTGLGALFGGTTVRQLFRAAGLGVLSVGAMLGLGLAFAFALAPFVPMGVEPLFISFAPGGVTEMGLIALSLGASPVLVSAHHVFRIALTVTLAGMLHRAGSFGLERKATPPAD